MERKYEDIPTQGQHRGSVDDATISDSVRAPMPPDPKEAKGKPVDLTYRLSSHGQKGTQRIEAYSQGGTPATETGYEEVGQYTSWDDLRGALPQHGAGKGPYAVFENTKTGEIYADAESRMQDNWTGDGRFDRVTLFEDEDEAAAYADAQQKG